MTAERPGRSPRRPGVSSERLPLHPSRVAVDSLEARGCQDSPKESQRVVLGPSASPLAREQRPGRRQEASRPQPSEVSHRRVHRAQRVPYGAAGAPQGPTSECLLAPRGGLMQREVQDDEARRDDHVADPGGRHLDLAEHEPDGHDEHVSEMSRPVRVEGCPVCVVDQGCQRREREGLLEARTRQTIALMTRLAKRRSKGSTSMRRSCSWYLKAARKYSLAPRPGRPPQSPPTSGW